MQLPDFKSDSKAEPEIPGSWCLKPSFAFFFITLVLVCTFGDPPRASAKVSLPSMFSDHMVLQRDQRNDIWGKADPGEKVRVTLGTQSKIAVTDADGNWIVALNPVHVRKPCSISIQGKNSIVIKDVQIGDLWLFSGQSNIAWPMRYSDRTVGDTKKIDKLNLRIYWPGDKQNNLDSYDLEGKWHPVTKQSSEDLHMAAIPVLFAAGLQAQENVPIGIMLLARGAVPLEAFLPPETIQRMIQKNFKPALMPPGVKTGDSFQAMFSPVLKLGFAGIIWYQGEGNYQTSASYRYLFPWFITDLRSLMNDSDKPFYFVQIPNHGNRLPELVDSFWAELRDAQTSALKLANVFMVVSVDTVRQNPAPLHPKEKKEIADRLVKLVRATRYGAKVAAQSPVLKSFLVSGNNLVLSFDRSDGKLSTNKNAAVEGFQLAGADKIFHRAKAGIEGGQICLSSSQVLHPVAARYAWEDNPACNVYCHDLPLAPFRTDKWATHPKLNPMDWPK